jgi:mono/diheme cytochrome c family protein
MTMGMKQLLSGFGLALTLVACAPDEGPAAPGYQTDVKPILDANCVRCHGEGDKLSVDPGLTGNLKGLAPMIVYLDHYEDRPNCGGGTMPCLGAKTNALLAALYVAYPDSNYNRMPPKPSERLSDRDIDLLKRWAAEMPPKP